MGHHSWSLVSIALFVCLIGSSLGSLSNAEVKRNVDEQSSCWRQCLTPDNEIFSPLGLQVGSQWIYDYESTALTFTHQNQTEISGLQLTATVNIIAISSCQAQMKLTNVRMSEEKRENELIEYKTALEKNIVLFSYINGRIENVCKENDEEENVLNIKRAILSIFQLESERPKQTDVTGTCDTVVYPDATIENKIFKEKFLSSCKNGNVWSNSLIKGQAYKNKQTDIQYMPITKNSYRCNYDLNPKTREIEQVNCIEKHLFQPFNNNENGIKFEIKQNLKLRSKNNNNDDQQQSLMTKPINQFTPSTIVFVKESTTTTTSTKEEDENSIENVIVSLEQLCTLSNGDVRPETPQYFIELVYTLRKISLDNLKKIRQTILKNQICSKDSSRGLSFFHDALAVVGTDASTELMVELISQNALQTMEVNLWLGGLSFQQNAPSLNKLRSVLKLLENIPLQNQYQRQSLLGISSMLNQYCRQHGNNVCQQQEEIKQIVNKMLIQLNDNCQHTTSEQSSMIILVLKSLGNVGANVNNMMETFNKCAHEKKNAIAVRVAALQAIQRLPCADDVKRETIHDLLEDVELDTELRIHAYLALMRCPSMEVITKVKNLLFNEKVNQVGSFIWTHLTNLRETADPTKRLLHDILQTTDLKKEFDLDKLKFSRNIEKSFFIQDMNIGAQVDSNLIWSQNSFLPRSVSFNLTTDLFGTAINFLDMELRLEGAEKILEKILGPKSTTKTPTTSYFDALKEIDASLGIRLFGQDVAFIDAVSQRNNLNTMERFQNPIQLLKKFLDIQNVQFRKSLLLSESSFHMVTHFGLPLSIAVNVSSSVDLLYNSKVEVDRKLRVKNTLRPSGAVYMSGRVSLSGLWNSHYGVKLSSTLHSSTHVESDVIIEKGKAIQIEVNTPKEKQEIISFQSDVYIVRGKHEKSLNLNTEDISTKVLCTGSSIERTLGVELCATMRYPHVISANNDALLPLRGPISGHLMLLKRDTQKGFLFTIRAVREHVWNQHYLIELNTPGSKIDRQIIAEFQMNFIKRSIKAQWRNPWHSIVFEANAENLESPVTKLLINNNIIFHIQGHMKFNNQITITNTDGSNKQSLMRRDEIGWDINFAPIMGKKFIKTRFSRELSLTNQSYSANIDGLFKMPMILHLSIGQISIQNKASLMEKLEIYGNYSTHFASGDLVGIYEFNKFSHKIDLQIQHQSLKVISISPKFQVESTGDIVNIGLRHKWKRQEVGTRITNQINTRIKIDEKDFGIKLDLETSNNHVNLKSNIDYYSLFTSGGQNNLLRNFDFNFYTGYTYKSLHENHFELKSSIEHSAESKWKYSMELLSNRQPLEYQSMIEIKKQSVNLFHSELKWLNKKERQLDSVLTGVVQYGNQFNMKFHDILREVSFQRYENELKTIINDAEYTITSVYKTTNALAHEFSFSMDKAIGNLLIDFNDLTQAVARAEFDIADTMHKYGVEMKLQLQQNGKEKLFNKQLTAIDWFTTTMKLWSPKWNVRQLVSFALTTKRLHSRIQTLWGPESQLEVIESSSSTVDSNSQSNNNNNKSFEFLLEMKHDDSIPKKWVDKFQVSLQLPTGRKMSVKFNSDFEFLKLTSQLEVILSETERIVLTPIYDINDGWTEKGIAASITLKTPYVGWENRLLSLQGLGQLRYRKLAIEYHWGQGKRFVIELTVLPKSTQDFTSVFRIITPFKRMSYLAIHMKHFYDGEQLISETRCDWGPSHSYGLAFTIAKKDSKSIRNWEGRVKLSATSIVRDILATFQHYDNGKTFKTELSGQWGQEQDIKIKSEFDLIHQSYQDIRTRGDLSIVSSWNYLKNIKTTWNHQHNNKLFKTNLLIQNNNENFFQLGSRGNFHLTKPYRLESNLDVSLINYGQVNGHYQFDSGDEGLQSELKVNINKEEIYSDFWKLHFNKERVQLEGIVTCPLVQFKAGHFKMEVNYGSWKTAFLRSALNYGQQQENEIYNLDLTTQYSRDLMELKLKWTSVFDQVKNVFIQQKVQLFRQRYQISSTIQWNSVKLYNAEGNLDMSQAGFLKLISRIQSTAMTPPLLVEFNIEHHFTGVVVGGEALTFTCKHKLTFNNQYQFNGQVEMNKEMGIVGNWNFTCPNGKHAVKLQHYYSNNNNDGLVLRQLLHVDLFNNQLFHYNLQYNLQESFINISTPFVDYLKQLKIQMINEQDATNGNRRRHFIINYLKSNQIFAFERISSRIFSTSSFREMLIEESVKYDVVGYKGEAKLKIKNLNANKEIHLKLQYDNEIVELQTIIDLNDKIQFQSKLITPFYSLNQIQLEFFLKGNLYDFTHKHSIKVLLWENREYQLENILNHIGWHFIEVKSKFFLPTTTTTTSQSWNYHMEYLHQLSERKFQFNILLDLPATRLKTTQLTLNIPLLNTKNEQPEGQILFKSNCPYVQEIHFNYSTKVNRYTWNQMKHSMQLKYIAFNQLYATMQQEMEWSNVAFINFILNLQLPILQEENFKNIKFQFYHLISKGEFVEKLFIENNKIGKLGMEIQGNVQRAILILHFPEEIKLNVNYLWNELDREGGQLWRLQVSNEDLSVTWLNTSYHNKIITNEKSHQFYFILHENFVQRFSPNHQRREMKIAFVLLPSSLVKMEFVLPYLTEIYASSSWQRETTTTSGGGLNYWNIKLSIPRILDSDWIFQGSCGRHYLNASLNTSAPLISYLSFGYDLRDIQTKTQIYFNYNNRRQVELKLLKSISSFLGVEEILVNFDLIPQVGGVKFQWKSLKDLLLGVKLSSQYYGSMEFDYKTMKNEQQLTIQTSPELWAIQATLKQLNLLKYDFTYTDNRFLSGKQILTGFAIELEKELIKFQAYINSPFEYLQKSKLSLQFSLKETNLFHIQGTLEHNLLTQPMTFEGKLIKNPPQGTIVDINLSYSSSHPQILSGTMLLKIENFYKKISLQINNEKLFPNKPMEILIELKKNSIELTTKNISPLTSASVAWSMEEHKYQVEVNLDKFERSFLFSLQFNRDETKLTSELITPKQFKFINFKLISTINFVSQWKFNGNFVLKNEFFSNNNNNEMKCQLDWNVFNGLTFELENGPIELIKTMKLNILWKFNAASIRKSFIKFYFNHNLMKSPLKLHLGDINNNNENQPIHWQISFSTQSIGDLLFSFKMIDNQNIQLTLDNSIGSSFKIVNSIFYEISNDKLTKLTTSFTSTQLFSGTIKINYSHEINENTIDLSIQTPWANFQQQNVKLVFNKNLIHFIFNQTLLQKPIDLSYRQQENQYEILIKTPFRYLEEEELKLKLANNPQVWFLTFNQLSFTSKEFGQYSIHQDYVDRNNNNNQESSLTYRIKTPIANWHETSLTLTNQMPATASSSGEQIFEINFHREFQSIAKVNFKINFNKLNSFYSLASHVTVTNQYEWKSNVLVNLKNKIQIEFGSELNQQKLVQFQLQWNNLNKSMEIISPSLFNKLQVNFNQIVNEKHFDFTIFYNEKLFVQLKSTSLQQDAGVQLTMKYRESVHYQISLTQFHFSSIQNFAGLINLQNLQQSTNNAPTTMQLQWSVLLNNNNNNRSILFEFTNNLCPFLMKQFKYETNVISNKLFITNIYLNNQQLFGLTSQWNANKFIIQFNNQLTSTWNKIHVTIHYDIAKLLSSYDAYVKFQLQIDDNFQREFNLKCENLDNLMVLNVNYNNDLSLQIQGKLQLNDNRELFTKLSMDWNKQNLFSLQFTAANQRRNDNNAFLMEFHLTQNQRVLFSTKLNAQLTWRQSFLIGYVQIYNHKYQTEMKTNFQSKDQSDLLFTASQTQSNDKDLIVYRLGFKHHFVNLHREFLLESSLQWMETTMGLSVESNKENQGKLSLKTPWDWLNWQLATTWQLANKLERKSFQFNSKLTNSPLAVQYHSELHWNVNKEYSLKYQLIYSNNTLLNHQFRVNQQDATFTIFTAINDNFLLKFKCHAPNSKALLVNLQLTTPWKYLKKFHSENTLSVGESWTQIQFNSTTIYQFGQNFNTKFIFTMETFTQLSISTKFLINEEEQFLLTLHHKGNLFTNFEHRATCRMLSRGVHGYHVKGKFLSSRSMFFHGDALVFSPHLPSGGLKYSSEYLDDSNKYYRHRIFTQHQQPMVLMEFNFTQANGYALELKTPRFNYANNEGNYYNSILQKASSSVVEEKSFAITFHPHEDKNVFGAKIQLISSLPYLEHVELSTRHEQMDANTWTFDHSLRHPTYAKWIRTVGKAVYFNKNNLLFSNKIESHFGEATMSWKYQQNVDGLENEIVFHTSNSPNKPWKMQTIVKYSSNHLEINQTIGTPWKKMENLKFDFKFNGNLLNHQIYSNVICNNQNLFTYTGHCQWDKQQMEHQLTLPLIGKFGLQMNVKENVLLYANYQQHYLQITKLKLNQKLNENLALRMESSWEKFPRVDLRASVNSQQQQQSRVHLTINDIHWIELQWNRQSNFLSLTSSYPNAKLVEFKFTNNKSPGDKSIYLRYLNEEVNLVYNLVQGKQQHNIKFTSTYPQLIDSKFTFHRVNFQTFFNFNLQNKNLLTMELNSIKERELKFNLKSQIDFLPSVVLTCTRSLRTSPLNVNVQIKPAADQPMMQLLIVMDLKKEISLKFNGGNQLRSLEMIASFIDKDNNKQLTIKYDNELLMKISSSFSSNHLNVLIASDKWLKNKPITLSSKWTFVWTKTNKYALVSSELTAPLVSLFSSPLTLTAAFQSNQTHFTTDFDIQSGTSSSSKQSLRFVWSRTTFVLLLNNNGLQLQRQFKGEDGEEFSIYLVSPKFFSTGEFSLIYQRDNKKQEQTITIQTPFQSLSQANLLWINNNLLKLTINNQPIVHVNYFLELHQNLLNFSLESIQPTRFNVLFTTKWSSSNGQIESINIEIDPKIRPLMKFHLLNQNDVASQKRQVSISIGANSKLVTVGMTKEKQMKLFTIEFHGLSRRIGDPGVFVWKLKMETIDNEHRYTLMTPLRDLLFAYNLTETTNLQEKQVRITLNLAKEKETTLKIVTLIHKNDKTIRQIETKYFYPNAVNPIVVRLTDLSTVDLMRFDGTLQYSTNPLENVLISYEKTSPAALQRNPLKYHFKTSYYQKTAKYSSISEFAYDFTGDMKSMVLKVQKSQPGSDQPKTFMISTQSGWDSAASQGVWDLTIISSPLVYLKTETIVKRVMMDNNKSGVEISCKTTFNDEKQVKGSLLLTKNYAQIKLWTNSDRPNDLFELSAGYKSKYHIEFLAKTNEMDFINYQIQLISQRLIKSELSIRNDVMNLAYNGVKSLASRAGERAKEYLQLIAISQNQMNLQDAEFWNSILPTLKWNEEVALLGEDVKTFILDLAWFYNVDAFYTKTICQTIQSSLDFVFNKIIFSTIDKVVCRPVKFIALSLWEIVNKINIGYFNPLYNNISNKISHYLTFIYENGEIIPRKIAQILHLIASKIIYSSEKWLNQVNIYNFGDIFSLLPNRDCFIKVMRPLAIVYKQLLSSLRYHLNEIKNNYNLLSLLPFESELKEFLQLTINYIDEKLRTIMPKLIEKYENVQHFLTNTIAPNNLHYFGYILKETIYNAKWFLENTYTLDKLQELLLSDYFVLINYFNQQLHHKWSDILNLDKFSYENQYFPEENVQRIKAQIYSPIPLHDLQSKPDFTIISNIKNLIKNVITKFSSSSKLISTLKPYWEIVTTYGWNLPPMRFINNAKKSSSSSSSWLPNFEEFASFTTKSNHVVTFDKHSYTLPQGSTCDFILVEDHKNYAWSVKTDDQRTSLLIHWMNSTLVKITKDYQILVNGKPSELPLNIDGLTVKHYGKVIKAKDNSQGLTVSIDLDNGIYTVGVSRWYHAKLAGLFGNMDNEPFNDFTRKSPKKMTENQKEFLTSWTTSQQCSIPDQQQQQGVVIVDSSATSSSKLACKYLFQCPLSPLAACFRFVDPKPFEKLCKTDCSSGSEGNCPVKKACQAAKLYAQHCKSAKAPVQLPRPCHKCNEEFQENDKLVFTSASGKADEADVVFIIEEGSTCYATTNKGINLRVKEMSQTIYESFLRRGITSVRFSFIGYNAKSIASYYTMNGQIFTTNMDNVNQLNNFEANYLANDHANVRFLTKSKGKSLLMALYTTTNYNFRPTASRHVILLPCQASSCANDKKLHRFTNKITTLYDKLNIHFNVFQPLTSTLDFLNDSSKKIIATDNHKVYYSRQPLGLPINSMRNTFTVNACDRLALHSKGAIFDNQQEFNQQFYQIFSHVMSSQANPTSQASCQCDASASSSASCHWNENRKICQPIVVESL